MRIVRAGGASAGTLVGSLYPSKAGFPFVSLIQPGAHQYPNEAVELVVRFFKEVGTAGWGSGMLAITLIMKDGGKSFIYTECVVPSK